MLTTFQKSSMAVCYGLELITLIYIKSIGLIGFYVPMFGETDYCPNHQLTSVQIEEQLDALKTAIGKIRYIGVSNETPYGLMKFCEVANCFSGYPRIASMQVKFTGIQSFGNGNTFWKIPFWWGMENTFLMGNHRMGA